jgi:2-polyprenyl-3-methyl-5-hydroxy-6-metoxy-1,4-benzoquinol methylase
MFNYLNTNNIIGNEFEIFHKGVRDDNSINVLKCKKTGTLILDKIIDSDYSQKGLNYWSSKSISESHIKTYDDDIRRVNLIKGFNNVNSILDFGCGNGGFLNLIDNKIKRYGIELNNDCITYLNQNNIKAYKSLTQIEDEIKFDCITLFHVLEHLSNPIEILTEIKKYMHDKTILIIEVPSANDILINKYNCDSFKNFTFWSEHLCLYTDETLLKLLEKVNFTNISIKNEQRYNIFNHLYWITHNKPGGHKIWNCNERELIESYNNYLKNNNCTDTILAYCFL